MQLNTRYTSGNLALCTANRVYHYYNSCAKDADFLAGLRNVLSSVGGIATQAAATKVRVRNAVRGRAALRILQFLLPEVPEPHNEVLPGNPISPDQHTLCPVRLLNQCAFPAATHRFAIRARPSALRQASRETRLPIHSVRQAAARCVLVPSFAVWTTSWDQCESTKSRFPRAIREFNRLSTVPFPNSEAAATAGSCYGDAMRPRLLVHLTGLTFATAFTVCADAAPLRSAAGATAAAVESPSALPAREPAVIAIDRWLSGLREITLPNGLRVFLAPDPESPTVSVCVTYDVGSRNEVEGQSGFAHLFEHMMFQGSRNVSKGEHFQLVTARGGQLNGTTSADRTNYFETLPSQELELGLWLEADRMRWLDISATNFENQRAVVKEEYRMRVENAAYRPALLELERLIFAGYAPYEHPTIGSMQSLDTAKLEWVQDFHNRYYGPNNAVLTVSGGFSAEHALELIRKYFGPATPIGRSTFAAPALPPARSAEHRAAMQDKNAKTPALLLGWRIPPAREKDHYALEMAARLLADGESSLLYESLVRRNPVAREVAAFTYDHRGPDAFVITVELNADSKLAEVERALDRHLSDLAEAGPGEEQLRRTKQRVKSSFVFGLQSNQARAIALGEYATFFENPRLIASDLSALLQVTRQQVSEAVRAHLSKSKRVVVTVQPTVADKKTQAGASVTIKEIAR